MHKAKMVIQKKFPVNTIDLKLKKKPETLLNKEDLPLSFSLSKVTFINMIKNNGIKETKNKSIFKENTHNKTIATNIRKATIISIHISLHKLPS